MRLGTRIRLLVGAVVLAALAKGSTPAAAAGVDGVPLCTAANDQLRPVATSDGAGGVIVAWHDERPSAPAGGVCYAQRLGAAGPQWTADGVALSTTGDAITPVIAADGAGGAFVAYAGSSSQPRVQWVNAAGVPQWGPDGIALSVTASPKRELAIAADIGGAGGAIVAWREDNGAAGTADVYAQKVSAAGSVQWSASGATVSATTMNSEILPALISDGAGGAIVVFLFAGGGGARIQRLNSAGAVQWGNTSLTSATNNNVPGIVSDGSGGAVVSWSGGVGIFAQRVSSAGSRLWNPTNGGVTLATTGTLPTMIGDGAGGATVTWQDLRSGTNFNLYAQRVDGSGVPQWMANGAEVCTATADQRSPTIVSDGGSGAIITWYDSRSGASGDDIFAQRIDATGAPLWPLDGVPVCTAPGAQQFPTLATDGSGGAFVAWQDDRKGTDEDIFAHHVNPGGQVLAVPRGEGVSSSARAWPTPFTDRVRLGFVLPADTRARMEVLDVSGRRVRSLGTALLAAGPRELTWDGRADDGRTVGAGTYFLRVEAAGLTFSRAVVRLK
jgi:hypothetical protein